MDNGQFQLLKQYVGPNLLNYVLNYDKITNDSSFDKLELLPIQVDVLDALHARIKQCRFQWIEQGGFGDGVDIFLRLLTSNGTSLFNHYYQNCGGHLVSPTSADPLVSYLQQICIEAYPNFLMKSLGLSYMMGMSISMVKNNDEIVRLVKDDVLDKITNKKEGYDYAFQFSTIDGLEFNQQISTAFSSIIARSFFDSCNRMDYSLSSVLKAIDVNIDVMRRLANDQSATYSSFIGIQGLRFQGFDAIELPGGVLRQFRDISNPGMHTGQTVVSHSDNEAGEYSGHVFEVFHSTEISSTRGATNTSNSIETNRVQENEFQKLRFSVVFSSLANRGPVPTFFEFGFPLINPGNYGFGNDHASNYILIDVETKGKLIEWYNVLSNKDLKRVQTPLKRLQYAIFERRDPEDAIVDAIIAWEGMFSEAFETTFKVAGSIAKFLRSGLERRKLFTRLKTLYKLRSDIVHGKDSKLLKRENIEDVRAEVINIGLECMMKIINNKRLLSMRSDERVHAILVLDESGNGSATGC